MAITVATNFNIQTNVPIDARTVVPTLQARNAITQEQRYLGLTVKVIETNKSYELINGLTDADWEDVTVNQNHATTNTIFGLGSDTLYGHVKLNDSAANTSTVADGTAATPYAVNQVNVALTDFEKETRANTDAMNTAVAQNFASVRAAQSAQNEQMWETFGSVNSVVERYHDEINENVSQLNNIVSAHYQEMNDTFTFVNSTIATHYTEMTENFTDVRQTITDNYKNIENVIADNYNEINKTFENVNSTIDNNYNDINNSFNNVNDSVNKMYDNLNNALNSVSTNAAPVYHACNIGTYGYGNNTVYGHVMLSDESNASLTVDHAVAATPAAVQKVQKYAEGLLAANDAMVFKGILNSQADIENVLIDNNWRVGWTYRIGTDIPRITGLKAFEQGDMLIAIAAHPDAPAAISNLALYFTDIQNNLDGAVIGPEAATEANIAVFGDASGKTIKDGQTTISSITSSIVSLNTSIQGQLTSMNTQTNSSISSAITNFYENNISDRLNGINTNIDNVNKRIDSSIDSYNTNIQKQLNQMNAASGQDISSAFDDFYNNNISTRLEEMNTKREAVNSKIDTVNSDIQGQLNSLDETVEVVNSRIDSTNAAIQTQLGAMNKQTTDNISSAINSLNTSLSNTIEDVESGIQDNLDAMNSKTGTDITNAVNNFSTSLNTRLDSMNTNTDTHISSAIDEYNTSTIQPKLDELEKQISQSGSSNVPENHSYNGTKYGGGTSKYYGHVMLSDSTTDNTNNASSSIAATPYAVNVAYAKATEAKTAWDAAAKDIEAAKTAAETATTTATQAKEAADAAEQHMSETDANVKTIKDSVTKAEQAAKDAASNASAANVALDTANKNIDSIKTSVENAEQAATDANTAAGKAAQSSSDATNASNLAAGHASAANKAAQAAAASAANAAQDAINAGKEVYAPVLHNNTQNIYGQGDETNFGHVKLHDGFNVDGGLATDIENLDATKGVAATPKAIYQLYQKISSSGSSDIPENHASSGKQYGVGTDTLYGHIKLNNIFNFSGKNEKFGEIENATGTAPTTKALVHVYNLATSKIDEATQAAQEAAANAQQAAASASKAAANVEVASNSAKDAADNASKAATSASTASSAAENAETSASNAEKSAEAAEARASEATTSADRAATDAENANQAAQLAQQAAANAASDAANAAKEIINDIAAPKNHASSSNTFGQATDSQFGHVLLTDNVGWATYSIANGYAYAVTPCALEQHNGMVAASHVNGHVRLTDSITDSSNNASNGLAATPYAVNQAYGKASDAYNKANSAFSKANQAYELALGGGGGGGGTIVSTGNVIDNSIATTENGDGYVVIYDASHPGEPYITNSSWTMSSLVHYTASHSSSTTQYGAANSTHYGHVKLSDSLTDNSNVTKATAATPKAVYDLYNTVINKAPVDHKSTENIYGLGNSTCYGHIKLSDSTTSNLNVVNGTAATPKAVHDLYNTVNGKAPISHACTVTTYGVGNSSYYGHLKLSDSTTSNLNITSGTAATPNAVHNVYNAVNGKISKLTSSTVNCIAIFKDGTGANLACSTINIYALNKNVQDLMTWKSGIIDGNEVAY